MSVSAFDDNANCMMTSPKFPMSTDVLAVQGKHVEDHLLRKCMEK